MTAALPPEAAGKPVEIWFADEARVGQQGTLTRVWARRGSRPRAPRDRRFEWAWLFGAAYPSAEDRGSAAPAGRWSAGALLGEAVHGLSEELDIGVGWIERAADPLQPLGVLLAVWISDRIEELAVSPGPADIFRWAASDCFDEAGVGDAGDGIGDALDSNRVFPAVAKVVEVFERFGADILQHVAKPGLAGIERPITEVWIRPAPADVARTDLVEMGVRPSQGSLQHEVQAIQAYCQRHLDPAQDGRFDIVELDPQVSDAGGGHAAKLRSSISRGQCHGNSS